MLVVEVPQEPSDGPILLSRTGSELSIEGSFDRLRAGVGFPIKGDWDVRWGILPIATQFVQKRPVASTWDW